MTPQTRKAALLSCALLLSSPFQVAARQCQPPKRPVCLYYYCEYCATYISWCQTDDKGQSTFCAETAKEAISIASHLPGWGVNTFCLTPEIDHVANSCKYPLR